MNEEIFIQVDSSHINFINRIMEGYEYLGVVSTVNRQEGILRIRVTPDTYKEVQLILANLPVEFAYLDNQG